MVKLNNNELKKLINKKSGEEPKKIYRTPADRFQDVLAFNKVNTFSDKISFQDNFCLIELNHIKLLSNNDVLRIDNRKLTSYKNQCKNRIKNLVNKKDNKYIKWLKFIENRPVKLEYIYAPQHGRKMDTTDGITGAFKYLVDGLVISGLLKDDTDDHIPFIIPKQFKGNDQIFILMTLIDNIEQYYSQELKSLIQKNNFK
jgi:hypothetical protein